MRRLPKPERVCIWSRENRGSSTEAGDRPPGSGQAQDLGAVGEGWGGKVDIRLPARLHTRSEREAGRPAGPRHLRAVGSSNAGFDGAGGAPELDGLVPGVRVGPPGRDVHRVHAARAGRCGDLEGPPQERADQAVPDGCGLGPAGLPGDRHPARHLRRAYIHRAVSQRMRGGWSGGGDDSPGGCHGRREEGAQLLQQDGDPGAWIGREHGRLFVTLDGADLPGRG
mmetsp:Transcript_13613/g.20010  ORF Transcript_13613/g.20010 Transcript_13613/m.20010 type:complete len:225 (+) Transcript_13613:174-848(+)